MFKICAPVIIVLNAIAGHVAHEDGLIRANAQLTASVIRAGRSRKLAKKPSYRVPVFKVSTIS